MISDHLKIFGDRKITVEDLLREKGQLVKKGVVGGDGEQGDLEFWDDGTEAVRGGEGAGGDKDEVMTYKKPKETVDADAAPGASFKAASASNGTSKGRSEEGSKL